MTHQKFCGEVGIVIDPPEIFLVIFNSHSFLNGRSEHRVNELMPMTYSNLRIVKICVEQDD
jgi:hypothetical protein